MGKQINRQDSNGRQDYRNTPQRQRVAARYMKEKYGQQRVVASEAATPNAIPIGITHLNNGRGQKDGFRIFLPGCPLSRPSCVAPHQTGASFQLCPKGSAAHHMRDPENSL